VSEPIFSGDPNQPQIALTFDDGPYEITRQLLDVLREHNVKATFFCVGKQVDAFPEITKQVHEEGHLLGNHTYEHLHLTQIDDTAVIDELRKTNTAIEKLTGYTPKYFRPTYDEYDDRVNNLAQTLGLTHINWSVDTNDWDKANVDSKKIIDTILTEVKNGSIILCHDLPDKDTVLALKEAIPQLQQRGLNFITVDKIVSTPQPSGRTYTVQHDDDLSKIAKKVYGDGSEQFWRIIYEANKGLIGDDPSKIQEGWELVIP
jgi:peptidoglycan/xylan/chitin deacetylase (PgdA/CDA1 family)